jgi:hypothetical protein
MANIDTRGAYELLRRAMQQPSLPQQGTDFGSRPNAAPEYDWDSYGSPQGGLLGRLLALQMEEKLYQRIPGNNEQAPSGPQNPNFRQVSRAPNSALLPMAGTPAPEAEASAPQPQAIQQYEADHAQQARDAAAARLARGARNLTRAETQRELFNLDPVDIAKSTGIGLANGAVNAVGLPADMLTGFGYLPNNYVLN